MRVHARISITEIRVGNMVVLISEIKRGAAVGCEQLHSATKLSREVEVRLPKHPAVEIEETATTREERFDAAEVHEVYLCTDGTALLYHRNTLGDHSPCENRPPQPTSH